MIEASLLLSLIGGLVEIFFFFFVPVLYKKAVDARFSYFSHFPYEVAMDSRKRFPLLLKEILAAVFAVLTSLGGILALLRIAYEAQGAAYLLVMAIGGMLLLLLAPLSEILLRFHFDLARERAHLILYFLDAASLALLGALAGAIALRFYAADDAALGGMLAFAIFFFLFALLSAAPLLYPRLLEGTKMDKVAEPDGSFLYVRPRRNLLALSEWGYTLIRIILSVLLSAMACYLAGTVSLL